MGTMPLDKVIAPSIAGRKGLCGRNPGQDLAPGKKNMGKWPATTEIFWKDGAP